MVFLYICKYCQDGEHDNCLGSTPPTNQRTDGPIVLGGSLCKCSCRRTTEQPADLEKKFINMGKRGALTFIE